MAESEGVSKWFSISFSWFNTPDLLNLNLLALDLPTDHLIEGI